MIWLWTAVGIVVGLPICLALVGAVLPKGHLATARAEFRQPPEAVWEAITDFEAMPQWRTGLQRVERGTDEAGRDVWIEHSRHGRMPLTIVEFTPPRRLVTQIVAQGLPFGGSWTLEIEPTASGAALAITENGEIYNPIFRVLARFVFGYHGTLEQYLRSLGRKFGETTTPLRVV